MLRKMIRLPSRLFANTRNWSEIREQATTNRQRGATWPCPFFYFFMIPSLCNDPFLLLQGRLDKRIGVSISRVGKVSRFGKVSQLGKRWETLPPRYVRGWVMRLGALSVLKSEYVRPQTPRGIRARGATPALSIEVARQLQHAQLYQRVGF